MENNTITIIEFLEKYTKASNDLSKSKCVKEVIKRYYAPVLDKKLVLNLMLEKSVVEDENKNIIDMFTNRINFIGAIIALYTYILPEKDENGNGKIAEMYDDLMKNGILDLILAEIGEREINELTSINGVLFDNWYAQNNSTEAIINKFIGTAAQRFGIAAGMGMESLSKVLEDEEKMNKFGKLLDNLLKKIK